jgi:arylsulfatase
MRTRIIRIAVALLAATMLFGGLAKPGLAQEQPKFETPPSSTPSVLPRPDFHFPGNVGRTYLDSDPPRFPPRTTT